jgi:pimeloyl-ACP methyl ester carboxylesterase
MIDGLVDAGFRIIRFDNRDVGRSTHVRSPPPGRLRQLLARSEAEDYELGDMAEDVVGLLDELRLAAADLVGMSLGGMIAQTVAARHPDRVRSLTSIFSTTGDRRVGQPARSTIMRMLRPTAKTREAYAKRHLSTLRHIGSTTFPFDESAEIAWALGAWDRAAAGRGAGVARQIGAIWKSGDRTAELLAISAPTLVLHGDADRMVHPSGGAATASAIPGARHETIVGMRHHLSPGVVPRLVQFIVEHTSPEHRPGVDA